MFDASITSIDTNGYALSAVGTDAGTTTTLTNCTLKSYSNYDSASLFSSAFINRGTLVCNNCYAVGTHSGVNNYGTLYVCGGVYESVGHGGIYAAFNTSNGAPSVSYVKDAVLRGCGMPEGYTNNVDANGYFGLYIGGSSSAQNINVYMDNCDIYGNKIPVVLNGAFGEQNNSLYISNSRINLDYTETGAYISNDTLKLYLGVGNNFTAKNTNRPSSVIVTNEHYDVVPSE